MIWNTTNYKGEPVTWYSSDVIERIRQEVQEHVTCEKRECSYYDDEGECLDCLKNTILEIIKDI